MRMMMMMNMTRNNHFPSLFLLYLVLFIVIVVCVVVLFAVVALVIQSTYKRLVKNVYVTVVIPSSFFFLKPSNLQKTKKLVCYSSDDTVYPVLC